MRPYAATPTGSVNVGIREQLLVNVGAGLALTGMRPIVHTFGTFLVERAFEQVKLGFGHQGVGGVLVGVGGSFDASQAGRTHQAPGDVALMDTLPDVDDPRPRHARPRPTRCSAARWPARGCTTCAWSSRPTPSPSPAPACTSYGAGPGATVVALGPVLDEVLEATADRDVTVLYAHTVRPFDAAHAAERADPARRGARGAVAGRHLGPVRRRRPGRRTPSPAGAGHAAYRAAALRHPRGAPARPRPRRRRASGVRVDSFLAA